MKYLIFLSTWCSLYVSAQFNGSIYSSSQTVCPNSTNSFSLTFQGSGGAAPYKFYYDILSDGNIYHDSLLSTDVFNSNGQWIGSNLGSSSTTREYGLWNSYNGQPILLPQPTLKPVFVALKRVTDAIGNNITYNTNFQINIGPYYSSSLNLPDTTVCEGAVVKLTGPTALQSPLYNYTWDQGVYNGVSFVINGTTQYHFTGYDQVSCPHYGTATIHVNSRPVIPWASIDSASCNDGKITLNNTQPHIEYTWGTPVFTSTYENLTPGSYLLLMEDTATGCTNWSLYDVPRKQDPGGCGLIAGNVVFDVNKNCSKDNVDLGIKNRIVLAQPGNHIAVTDINGVYAFYLPHGTYEISYPQAQASACSGPFTHTIDSMHLNFQDAFYDTFAVNYDVFSELFVSPIRPGFQYNITAQFKNREYYVPLMNEKAWVVIPPNSTLIQTSIPAVVSNDTAYFDLNTIQAQSVSLTLQLSQSVALGQHVPICAGIFGNQPEQDTLNNTSCIQATVIGSYDPNDKRLYVQDAVRADSLAMSEQELTYMIRFQNTGTAEAINIFVIDTISEYLDLRTFEFLNASYPCQVSYLGDRIYKFSFSGINLPDSTSNEPESHGFIRYKIKQDAANVAGSTIENTAHIYFDFNEAVVTNTTAHLLYEPALNTENLRDAQVLIYPNPSTDHISLRSAVQMNTIKLINMEGKVVFEQDSFSNQATVCVNQLANGLYTVLVQTDFGVVTSKLIVQ